MKKLNLLILRSYFGPFIATFFISIFVLLMQFLWKYVDDLVGKGFEWYIIAELLFYASSTFVPMALPLAILLSSIMTLGNMGEKYELVAIKASGISLQKAIRPLIFASIAISILAFYFSNHVLPVANLKMGSLLYDVRSQKPALNIKEGIFYYGIENYVIKVGKKEKDGSTIHDVIIYDHSQSRGNRNLILAKKGFMKTTEDERFLIFTLYEGTSYEDVIPKRSSPKNMAPFQRTSFQEQYIKFDLSGFELERTNEEFFKDNYRMLSLNQLFDQIDTLEEELNTALDDYYKRLSKRFIFLQLYDSVNQQKIDSADALNKPLLSNFSQSKQQKIIDLALTNARNVKNYISHSSREIEARQKHLRKHRIEMHKKFTLSFACFVLFFIGAPLGAIIRKGGFGLPVVISVFLFILYYILTMTSERIVREGVLPAYQGSWIASMILLPLGIFLTYKATTDSSIFDISAYTSFFKKLKIRSLNLRKSEK